MNTFSNGGIYPSTVLAYSHYNLNQIINMRGRREQYAALLLTGYTPNAKKRLCKGTRSGGGEVFTKYDY